MQTISFDSEYFNIKDTLSCGQVFRFFPFNEGFILVSKNNACFLYSEGGKTYIKAENIDYFKKYFDLSTDYAKIVKKAKSYDNGYLNGAAEYGKGIRILKQCSFETTISFLISQNNNIPRIKSIIEKLCKSCGEPLNFLGQKLYSFPALKKLLFCSESDFKSMGMGYRAAYLFSVLRSDIITTLQKLEVLPTKDLKAKLMTLKGVGGKVAECILLFGFNRFDSFPVDTWIDKIYRENFGGKEKDRDKISAYFLDLFKDYSGYIQQYLFYYKRRSV